MRDRGVKKKQRCKIYAPSYHIFVLGESGEESNLFFEAWKGRDCGESVIIIFKSTSFQKTFLWRSVLGRLYQGLIFFEWILNVERGIFLLTEDLQYFYSFTVYTIDHTPKRRIWSHLENNKTNSLFSRTGGGGCNIIETPPPLNIEPPPPKHRNPPYHYEQKLRILYGKLAFFLQFS